MEGATVSKQNTKILVAVDGSDESLEVIRYVSESTQPASSEIVLYTVLGKVPEVFWDLGKDHCLSQIEAARKWEEKQLNYTMAFMAKAVQILKQAGFHPAHITTKISPQQEGMARDIMAEAQRRYDVLVIGRGKSGSAQNGILGGVASKIVSSRISPTVWLVGGHASSEKILVAMDSSENSMKAVSHVGSVLNRNKNAITLFNAIRGITITSTDMEDIFPDSYQQQLLEDAERGISPYLLKAEALLSEMDISPERITTTVVTGVRSRATAVIEEARKGDHGTIVVGRRGISEVTDFSMGRVTNKLIQLAKDETLCIVD